MTGPSPAAKAAMTSGLASMLKLRGKLQAPGYAGVTHLAVPQLGEVSAKRWGRFDRPHSARMAPMNRVQQLLVICPFLLNAPQHWNSIV